MIGSLFLLLLGVGYVLMTMETAEEKAIRQHKQDFVIAYPYEEDLIRPILEEEKTIEQLVEDVVKEQLGVGVPKSAFNEVGIREGIGLFAEAAIYDGEEIPTFPAITQAELKQMQKESTDAYLQENFERIMSRKERAVASQRLKQENERDVILKELQEKLAERE